MLSQLAPLTVADQGKVFPDHQIKDLEGWKIHVSNELLQRQAEATGKTLELLSMQLQEIARVVPPAALNKLRQVPLWISAAQPPKAPFVEYHSTAETLRKHHRDPALAKSVEFTNIINIERELKLRPDLLLQTFAQAYHDLVVKDGFLNVEVHTAYERAAVSRHGKKSISRPGNARSKNAPAFVAINSQEYFAKCSAALLSTSAGVTAQSAELARLDPEFQALLQRLWGIPLATPASFEFLQRKQLGESLPPTRWLENGDYLTLRAANIEGDKYELIRCSISGVNEVLVSTNQLLPPGANEPLTIDGYEFTQDLEWILIYTNSVRVWRKKTRGDYWLFRRLTGKLTKLCPDALPSTLMYAKLSPTGAHVGYVRDNNLFVASTADGSSIQLTFDGSTDVINGMFDWVYEEEFRCYDGWRWSPDGQAIAYWQLNTMAVKKFTMIDNTNDQYPILKTFAYPKTGELNSVCRIGVCALQSKNTVWLQIPGSTPNDFYLPRMDWVKHSSEILIQRINRRQNALDVLLADPATGNVRTVCTEREDAWIDIHDDALHWNKNGTQFTWISERDGWRQLYYVSADGTTIRRVTNGQHDVIKVLLLDEAQNRVYYLASPEDGTQRFLYCDSITGKSSPRRLTPDKSVGWHNYLISPNGKYAVHTYSQHETPPKVDLISLPTHQVIRSLIRNEQLHAEVKQLSMPPIEYFQVEIEQGVKLDSWLMKPKDYDPSKKYPILFYVYGEPAAQAVTNQWQGKQYLWHMQMAQLGYMVACVDNRGTPAPRGREWRKAAYRKIGSLAAAEQAAAARELLKRPDLDPERVAVWGWSGGGSATLNLLFRYPEIYRTGMAVAAVPDMRLYNTIYQERYMGLPQDNLKDYEAGSPLTHARGLKGNLLLVHGSGDDNCHQQGMEILVDKLIELNLHFTMMSYPNRSHSIDEGNNTTRHLYDLLKQYLQRNIPAGPR